jgi:DNA-binding transcriptional MerR regulator
MGKKIGEVALILGVSVDTLRYYEKINLLGQVSRSEGGVRFYDNKTISSIRFIRHAQRMGFSLDEIRDLLDFRQQPTEAKPQVRSMVREKLLELEQQINDLSQLRDDLQGLTNECESSHDGDCPILKNFEK